VMYEPAIKETAPPALVEVVLELIAPVVTYVPAISETAPPPKPGEFIVPVVMDVPAIKETEPPAPALVLLGVIAPLEIYVPQLRIQRRHRCRKCLLYR